MLKKDLRKAYERDCILISDVVAYNQSVNKMLIQPRPRRGPRPNFIKQMAEWIADDDDIAESERLKSALNPPVRCPSLVPYIPQHPIPFTLEQIRDTYCWTNSSAQNEEKWVAYTDGSVIQQDGKAMGSFAGTFVLGPDRPTDFQGRVLELPLSSTKMEAMAIIVAIAITPPSTPLDIYTDSEAARHMMHRVMAPIVTREVYNSPDAFIWLHLRDWLQSRDAVTTVYGVRGHSGDPGNEKAD
jgi:ribonuclease HI